MNDREVDLMTNQLVFDCIPAKQYFGRDIKDRSFFHHCYLFEVLIPNFNYATPKKWSLPRKFKNQMATLKK